MKKIIIVIVCFFCVGCLYAQVGDSVKARKMFSGSTADFYYPNGVVHFDTGYTTRDTSMVIMLFCDTSLSEFVMLNKTISMPFSIVCYWQYGYSVTQHYSMGALRRWFIDADKKPLSKNIVIFQSLKLN